MSAAARYINIKTKLEAVEQVIFLHAMFTVTQLLR